MENQGYKFSWEREEENNPPPLPNQYNTQYGMNSVSPANNQVAPPAYSQVATPGSYPQTQMAPGPPAFLGPEGTTNLKREQPTQLASGKYTWNPNPAVEGPYRPFIVKTGRGGRAGITCIVDAKNDEELAEEIDTWNGKLKRNTFICFWICALMGFKHIKMAREHLKAGNDTEARNSLLEAQHKEHHSWILGIIFNWSCFLFILNILALPFIWIPYLIYKA